MRDGHDGAGYRDATDRASFDAVFDRLFGLVSCYARAHTPTRAAARQVVEETLREVFEALVDGSLLGDPAPVAYVIVRRRCAETAAGRLPRARRLGQRSVVTAADPDRTIHP